MNEAETNETAEAEVSPEQKPAVTRKRLLHTFFLYSTGPCYQNFLTYFFDTFLLPCNTRPVDLHDSRIHNTVLESE